METVFLNILDKRPRRDVDSEEEEEDDLEALVDIALFFDARLGAIALALHSPACFKHLGSDIPAGFCDSSARVL